MNAQFDVIIVGGSYAGLSAAMSLARSFRNVLIIDAGERCNRQTPFAHNFITHDGDKPGKIADHAKEEVLMYPTVRFVEDKAVSARKLESGFEIRTQKGTTFHSRKLLLATGIKDTIPGIPGFDKCWGISVLHCPYCHGYEVKDQPTGIIANGDVAYELAKMVRSWTTKLTVYTNGPCEMTAEQLLQIREHGIELIEKEIREFAHTDGKLKQVIFTDGSTHPVVAVYGKIGFTHSSQLHEELGCEMEDNLIKIDETHKTSIDGVYAAGDNSGGARAIIVAAASGSVAGMCINTVLIDEEF